MYSENGWEYDGFDAGKALTRPEGDSFLRTYYVQVILLGFFVLAFPCLHEVVRSLLHFVGREAKAQRLREVACPTVEPGGSGVGLRKQTHCEKLAPFCKGALMAKGGPLRTSRQWSEQDREPKN